MRKILITGAHSTGKTSLVDLLAAELSRTSVVRRLTDVARSCPFPIGKSQDDRGTLWLLHQQVANELSIESEGPDFLICDRGIPDIFGHWLDIEERRGRSTYLTAILPHLKSWSTTYDMVFHSIVDEAIPQELDGVRDSDDSYRLRMQGLIADALRALEIQTIKLPDQIAVRLRFVLSRLGEPQLVKGR
jgi:hypothetical protein